MIKLHLTSYWHQLERVMDDMEVENGGVLVLEKDVLVEVDELVVVLAVLVEDIEEVLLIEIEVLDGELVYFSLMCL